MLFTAWVIGLVGSLHCIGMCSPLAMAITHRSPKVMTNRLLYHLGRILVYGILGSLIASVGYAFSFSQYQNRLSLGLGIAMIIFTMTDFAHVRMRPVNQFLSTITQHLKSHFSNFLQKKNYSAVFFMGMINGLLPCGLTWLALSNCIILSAPEQGFLFMLFFGLGTLPALIGFSSLFTRVVRYFHFNTQRTIKVFFFISGVLLIGRVFIFHAHEIVANHSATEVICK